MWLWPALLLLIPLGGVVGVVVAPARQAKWIALLATTITFVHSVILAVAFKHWHDGGFGLEADHALGHSLGELSALHWAGAIDEQLLPAVVMSRSRTAYSLKYHW